MRPKNNIYTALILFALIFFVAIVKWGQPTDLFIFLKHLYLSVLSFFLTAYIFIEKGPTREFSIGKVFPFFAAFLVFAAASLMWSVNKFFALKDLFFFWNLFVIYFAVTNIAGKEDIPSALKLIVLFGIIVAFYDIVTTADGLFGERLKHVSTLGNPGYIGEYLLISSGAALGLLASLARNNASAITYALIFLFLFFSILLTQTRASILAVIAAAVFLAYKIAQAKRWASIKMIFITVFLALLIALAIPGKGYLMRFTHGVGSDAKTISASPAKQVTHSTLKGRLLLYNQTINMIKDSPLLGVGLGNYSIHYPKYKESIRNKGEEHTKLYSAHNVILNFTSECGIPGLFFILALFFYITLPFMTNMLKGKAEEGITLPLGAIFIGTVASSFFGFNITRPEYGAAFIACVGMLDIINSPGKFKIGKGVCAGVFTFFLIICALAAVFHLNMVKSEIEMQKGIRYYSARDGARAIEYFNRAYKYNPYDEKLLFYCGTTYYLLGDYEKAELFLGKGLKLYPYEQRYSVNYATTLFAEKKYDEAEKVLSECLKNVPTAYMAANQLAIIYKRIYRDDAKAQEFVNKSMEIDPFQGPIDLERSPI